MASWRRSSSAGRSWPSTFRPARSTATSYRTSWWRFEAATLRLAARARRNKLARRIRISDAFRLRCPEGIRGASEDQADIGRTLRLHRGVEEKLVEHVVLRVAAAEAMHVI